jgi:uncharacterized membrane protein YdbT with pleckstrin-like domain
MDFSTKFERLKPSYFNAVISAIHSSWNILYSFLLYIFYILINAFFENGSFSSIQVSPIQILLIIYLFLSVLSAIYNFFKALIDIYFTIFTLYNSQIQFSYGIFSKTSLFLPKNKITDTQISQSLLEKILSLKSVSLSVPNNPTIAVIRGIRNDVFLPDLLIFVAAVYLFSSLLKMGWGLQFLWFYFNH